MATTLRDIAHACDMDISTVSRALRSDERVTSKTRERIVAVARDMGYVPNLSARSLAGAKTRTIWYLIPSLVEPVQIHCVQEASRYLAESGYELSIILYRGDAERYLHLLRRLSQGVTDGAIIVPGPTGRGEEQLQALAAQRFPIVFLDRYPEASTLPAVTSDNAGAAAEMATRLVEQGAVRFVVLFNREANLVEQARLQGVVAYLGEAGLPFVIGDRFDPAFLQQGECLGVIATSQHAVRRFIESALPVPPPLRVAVFDDWQGDPYPATHAIVCRQNLTDMARTACDLVLGMIDGHSPTKTMHRIAPERFDRVVSQVK